MSRPRAARADEQLPSRKRTKTQHSEERGDDEHEHDVYVSRIDGHIGTASSEGLQSRETHLPLSEFSPKVKEWIIAAYLGFTHTSDLRVLAVSWPSLRAALAAASLGPGSQLSTALELLRNHPDRFTAVQHPFLKWPSFGSDNDTEAELKNCKRLAAILSNLKADLEYLASYTTLNNRRLQSQFETAFRSHNPDYVVPSVEYPVRAPEKGPSEVRDPVKPYICASLLLMYFRNSLKRGEFHDRFSIAGFENGSVVPEEHMPTWLKHSKGLDVISTNKKITRDSGESALLPTTLASRRIPLKAVLMRSFNSKSASLSLIRSTENCTIAFRDGEDCIEVKGQPLQLTEKHAQRTFLSYEKSKGLILRGIVDDVTGGMVWLAFNTKKDRDSCVAAIKNMTNRPDAFEVADDDRLRNLFDSAKRLATKPREAPKNSRFATTRSPTQDIQVQVRATKSPSVPQDSAVELPPRTFTIIWDHSNESSRAKENLKHALATAKSMGVSIPSDFQTLQLDPRLSGGEHPLHDQIRQQFACGALGIDIEELYLQCTVSKYGTTMAVRQNLGLDSWSQVSELMCSLDSDEFLFLVEFSVLTEEDLL